MNKKISGGLVLFNLNKGKEPTFLIAHPGGPFFKNRDDGWWSIPKGEPEANESIFEAAKREFEEETGMKPYGPYINLGDIVQKNGKRVFAWGFEGKWPTDKIPVCNHITLEYPKGTGKTWTFPEIDKAIMMNLSETKKKLRAEQFPLILRLFETLGLKE